MLKTHKYVIEQLTKKAMELLTRSNEARLFYLNLIYQTAEDGLGDTIKPRLIEAGADVLVGTVTGALS